LPDDPLHYRLPSLASGDVQVAYITNAAGDGKKSQTLPLSEYDTGALQDISPLPSVPMGSNPLPIALVLSTDAVSAPYFVEPGSDGRTDIVLTFPMGKHGIYNHGTLSNDLDGEGSLTACSGNLSDGVDDGEAVTLDGFTTTVHDYPHDGDGGYCENAGYESNSIFDVVFALNYRDYEYQSAEFIRDDCWGWTLCPVGDPNYRSLARRVNVISAFRGDGTSATVFFTPTENVFSWPLDAGFIAGWLTIDIDPKYDYETNSSIGAVTEIAGGIGAESNTWTGVPLIGFSVMAANVGSSQVGESVELIRSVNRNQTR
jgi:hypothetical protein